jgi:ferredoxin
VTASGLEILVDRDRCMGSGSCSFHAPNTFDLDDEAKVVLLDRRDTDAAIRVAVESCPTRALTITSPGDTGVAS